MKLKSLPLAKRLLYLSAACLTPPGAARSTELFLKPENFRPYVETFDQNDNEQKKNFVDNAAAWGWMEKNIPLFECSDKELEELYYFRWWTFRKHIRKTPDGFVVTEFLPDVVWAGKKHNTISDSAPHHFYEGRWLRDHRYLKDYAYFWFRKGGEPRRYSFAAADAILAWCKVTGDRQTGIDLLPDLIKNYQAWESDQDANGLFWQIDDRDGMEMSIGGSGYRPTINSYMYGDAVAIGEIAKWAGNPAVSQEFALKATKLRELVETNLWDESASFYKVLPRGEKQKLVDVREQIGYVPWFYNLPKPGREVAWKQLIDPKGFQAPFGPTTAEQRHPCFMQSKSKHECLWDGPSWPFATSQTLVALGNLLNGYRQDYVGKKDYFDVLKTYARSQRFKLPDGKEIPWIDEDLDPFTGEWIARRELYKRNDRLKDRGRDYNHSTFNDLVITGAVGLRPQLDQWIEVNPLVPDGALDYFCLDNVRYHDSDLTIIYDRTGQRYGKGAGLRVFADGREIGSSPKLERFRVPADLTPADSNPAVEILIEGDAGRARSKSSSQNCRSDICSNVRVEIK